MKRILYIAFIILCFSSTQSCSKQEALNPLPTSLITEATSFSTPDRVLNQVYGLYSTFKQTGLYGSQYIIFSEIKAGEFVSANLNPLQGALTYMGQVESGTPEVNLTWRHAYQLINGCNTFLAGMDQSGTAVVGEATAKKYIAEARSLRAIVYYNLLQLYAQPFTKDNGASPGVPVRLTPSVGLQDYSLARSTVAKVYEQILADMDFAEANLALNNGTAAQNTIRLHKNSIIALKSRVYLSMGKYDKVVEEASKIVSASAPFTAAASGGVANALDADVTAVFKSPYTSVESMFSVPFTSNDVPGTPLANYFLPLVADASGLGSVGNGQYYIYRTGIFADADWRAADKRRSFIFTTPSGAQTGRPWLVKFRVGTPYTDNAPVIRYAEVLLNLSEALLRQNGATSITRAKALLSAVRNRSDATYVVAAADVPGLLDAIIKERRIEFLGEGLRNGDLMRLGLEIPAKTPTGSIAVPAIAPTAPNYIWPLPNEELLYNKGI